MDDLFAASFVELILQQERIKIRMPVIRHPYFAIRKSYEVQESSVKLQESASTAASVAISTEASISTAAEDQNDPDQAVTSISASTSIIITASAAAKKN